MQITLTHERVKAQAKTLRQRLKQAPSFQQTLEILAEMHGYADYGAMKAAMAADPATSTPTGTPTGTPAGASPGSTGTVPASEALLRALAPFGQTYDYDDGDDPREMTAHAWESPEAMGVTIGDFKRAREALKAHGRGDLLDHRTIDSGPAHIRLTFAEVLSLGGAKLGDLHDAEHAGKITFELADTPRSTLEDHWDTCGIVESRMEDPRDLAEYGFVAMGERSDLTLLYDLHLNGSLEQVAREPITPVRIHLKMDWCANDVFALAERVARGEARSALVDIPRDRLIATWREAMTANADAGGTPPQPCFTSFADVDYRDPALLIADLERHDSVAWLMLCNRLEKELAPAVLKRFRIEHPMEDDIVWSGQVIDQPDAPTGFIAAARDLIATSDDIQAVSFAIGDGTADAPETLSDDLVPGIGDDDAAWRLFATGARAEVEAFARALRLIDGAIVVSAATLLVTDRAPVGIFAGSADLTVIREGTNSVTITIAQAREWLEKNAWL